MEAETPKVGREQAQWTHIGWSEVLDGESFTPLTDEQVLHIKHACLKKVETESDTSPPTVLGMYCSSSLLKHSKTAVFESDISHGRRLDTCLAL